MIAQKIYIDFIDKKTAHKFHFPISVFKKPTNEKEYASLEKVLNKLIDIVKEDEHHPLADVMEIIGENLEHYDNENCPAIGDDVTEIQLIHFLMESHNLKQADLAEIFGGQSNVSRFLNGERSLSKAQIIKLKNKFNIKADYFLREN